MKYEQKDVGESWDDGLDHDNLDDSADEVGRDADIGKDIAPIPVAIDMREVLQSIARGLRYDMQKHGFQLVRDLVVERIRKSLTEKIEMCVERFVQEEVNRVLTGTIQPTNSWGEPKGEPTTLRDMMTKLVKEHLDQRVDSSGRVTQCSGNNTYPRSEYLVRNALQGDIDKAVDKEVKIVVADVRKQLAESATKKLGSAIIELLGAK